VGKLVGKEKNKYVYQQITNHMVKNPRTDESILNLATSKRRSLRTTVPAFIVDQFELKPGDKLQWKIVDGKLEVEMKKEEQRPN
jgi:hypothetical protein